MLFMVIEHFKPDSMARIGERFERSGRMLPEGVSYYTSWVESNPARCFQIMEAANLQKLQDWVSQWSDLIDFEMLSVESSVEFWARTHAHP